MMEPMGKDNLNGLTIAVLGGDERQLYLLHQLAVECEADIRVCGLPAGRLPSGVSACFDVNRTIYGEDENNDRAADVILLPMPGINDQGMIFAPLSGWELYLYEEHLAGLKPGALILSGKVNGLLHAQAEKYNLKTVELTSLDELAIYNAVPSAEGAIQTAMDETVITIHGSNCYILGFGRCGKALAHRLNGLYANVVVFARKAQDRAAAAEAGCLAFDLDYLTEEVKKADIIFNTIADLILTSDILEHTSPEVVIIDIASAPGGTDFAAAEKLGRKALLTPGLPGKTAPKSAGMILARVIPGLIREQLKR